MPDPGALRLPAWAATYLAGEFHHGTARRNTAFLPHAPAYFTSSRAEATDYALRDAEIDAGTPVLITARLSVSAPAFLPLVTMQDLHLPSLAPLLAELVSSGHDCALSNTAGHDEVAVFGASSILILSISTLAAKYQA